MSIDRLDWHAGADNFPKNMPYENGGNHIGYFMEYLYKHDFIPDSADNAIEEYLKVKNGEKNGLQFLMENCDEKFWDVDTNEEGLQFTNYLYNDYLSNVENVLGHNPYKHKYSIADYQKVEIWLDEQFSIWSKKGKPLIQEPAKKEASPKGFWRKLFKK